MDINRPSAGCACPAFLLVFHKRTNVITAYRFKVLGHAHAIFFPVGVVQLFKPPARELVASMVVPAPYPVTREECAVPPAQSFGTVTPPAPVVLSEMSRADRADHTAGSTEDRPKIRFLRAFYRNLL